MDLLSIILVIVYLMVTGYLGYLGYRQTKTAADYLVAGRSANPVVMALSYGATFISTSAIVGFGGGPLYPLTVDAFYAKAGDDLDSVSMGAYCALASGAAVTIGPLALGVLADAVGLRWAILVVPALALLGAVTQRPRRTDRSY